MAHNTQQLDGRSLEKFPQIVSKLKTILERFQQALSCKDQCFIADQTLEQLPTPSQVGQSRVGGIDFNKPRMRWVAEAVLALAPNPRGFTACGARNPARLDYHYETLRLGMRGLFQELGIGE